MKLFKFVPVLALIGLAGCTSTAEKTIAKDIAQQPESTSAQAAVSGRKAIETSDKLSVEQKQKMLSLMDQTQVEMATIRKNEAQVKASLFKYLAAGNFENREISAYRHKLKKIEDKKMDLMFSNIKETRKILGKDIMTDPDMMDFNRMSAEYY